MLICAIAHAPYQRSLAMTKVVHVAVRADLQPSVVLLCQHDVEHLG